MPKPSKIKPKQKPKTKPKRKAEPEVPGFTTKKTYWVMLATVLAVTSAVLGLISGLNVLKTTVLTVAMVVPIGCIGYIRVSPSKLSLSKRATFLFIGISVIGFGIWAAIVLLGGRYGLTTQMINALGSQLFIVTSLVICFSVGAVIGELIGRSKAVQERLFNPLDEKN